MSRLPSLDVCAAEVVSGLFEVRIVTDGVVEGLDASSALPDLEEAFAE